MGLVVPGVGPSVLRVSRGRLVMGRARLPNYAIEGIEDAISLAMGIGRTVGELVERLPVGFKVETMIYRKTSYPRSGSLLFYQNAFEYMFIFVKGSPKTFNPIADKKNRYAGSVGSKREADGSLSKYDFTVKDVGFRDNVWDYDPGFMKGTKYKKAHEHPAIFPEGLARDHILTWTNENDIVLDVCAGSGTTLDMAKRLSRRYLGVEISPEYVTLAENRLLATPVPLFGQGRGLTPREPDKRDSAPSQAFSTPDTLFDLEGLS